ncbi:MAG: hypothetical protein AB8F74_13630, partial [Saprospiraceae bacterium]
FYLAKELKNNLFQEESEFHFALSAFENDQKTLARKELEKISEQGGFYAEQANDFLELNF